MKTSSLLVILLAGFASAAGAITVNSTNVTGASLLDAGLVPSTGVFNTRGIAYPAYRYKPWSSLDVFQKTNAKILGYEEESWNVPGTAEIEMSAYETIEFDSLTTVDSKQQKTDFVVESPNATVSIPKTKFEALFALGFTDWEVYDCYVVHYGDYYWSDMDEAVVAAWEALGWTESAWNGGESDYPDSESKDWFQLTADEKLGAAELCYLPEIWQMLSFEFWEVDYAALSSGGAALENGIMVVDDKESSAQAYQFVDNVAASESHKPINRFLVWDAIPQDNLDIITSLGYTEETWAKTLAAPIEKLGYNDLDADQLLAVDALGFGPKAVWDCWLHHYETYHWEQLELAGVHVYLTVLGWTPLSWQGVVEPPATSEILFEELAKTQQHAVEQLCYNQEMWDNENFLLIPEIDAGHAVLALGGSDTNDVALASAGSDAHNAALTPALEESETEESGGSTVSISITNTVDFPDMGQSITVIQTDDELGADTSSSVVVADEDPDREPIALDANVEHEVELEPKPEAVVSGGASLCYLACTWALVTLFSAAVMLV